MEEKNVITYEEAIRVGIREGIKYLKEQEYNKTTKRYDRRLRNTRLLLRHYRGLKAHNKMASSSVNQINDDNAIDVLDDIESIDDEEQYVQALGRTRRRTLIIVGHINRVLTYYESICNADGSIKQRKYKIIKAMYIDPIKDDVIPTYEEISEIFGVNIRTIGRDVQDAVKDLSILFFGIDGIKL